MTDEPKYCAKHPGVRLSAPDCPRCGGDGSIEDEDDHGFDGGLVTCYLCHGKGWAPWLTCDWCDEDAMDEESNYWESASGNSG